MVLKRENTQIRGATEIERRICFFWNRARLRTRLAIGGTKKVVNMVIATDETSFKLA